MLRTMRLALLLALAGCTATRELPAPPEAIYEQATIAGYEDVRLYGDEAPDRIADLFGNMLAQVEARVRREGGLPNDGRFDVLVLSGGGSDGPFGAGLLKAWSERGDRPEFGIVTGVSVGALIAPFAFLGPEYDPALETLMTSFPAGEIADPTSFAGLLGGALGINRTTPLAETLSQVFDADFVARIAEQHALGRRLYVGTTNLDAERPVIWDIGRIAASGRPDAPRLIQNILLASSAVPIAFPPVMFEVEAGGRTFSEMHVDGGVTQQLFLYPLSLALPGDLAERLSPLGPGTIYVIRNTKLDPDYRESEAGVLDVAARALQTQIKTSGRNDVRQLAERAERDGFRMKVAAVPEEFDVVPANTYNPEYMRALYDLGYRVMQAGDPWRIVVPKLDEELTIAENPG